MDETSNNTYFERYFKEKKIAIIIFHLQMQLRKL